MVTTWEHNNCIPILGESKPNIHGQRVKFKSGKKENILCKIKK